MTTILLSALGLAAVGVYRNRDETRAGLLITGVCGALSGAFLAFVALHALGEIETSYQTCLRTHSQATCTETLR